MRIALHTSASVDATTKCIAISSQGLSPVSIATNFVYLLCLSALLSRHLIYPATVLATSSSHLYHLEFHETSYWILCLPQYPSTCLSWCCQRTSSLHSSGIKLSPLHVAHFVTSIPPSSISSVSPSLWLLSSSRLRSSACLQYCACIPAFTPPERLDRQSGLPILLQCEECM